jgi:hypothetical protein
MFCNEPIINVYTGQSDVINPKTGKYYDITYSHLEYCEDIAYYVGSGECIVLETQNYAIFLDSDGVHLMDAPAKPRSDKELLNPCVIEGEPGFADWVYFEQTFFAGEVLRSVKKEGDIYYAEFTDFTLKILPFDHIKQTPHHDLEYYMSYRRIRGCERHIKRKCPECGGDGEILLDHVEDYMVCCKKCKRATWAGMCLIDAIEDWNDGDLNCDLSNSKIW